MLQVEWKLFSEVHKKKDPRTGSIYDEMVYVAEVDGISVEMRYRHYYGRSSRDRKQTIYHVPSTGFRAIGFSALEAELKRLSELK